MGFSLFTQELAIDLGTANTVIFQNDKIVLDEPSIIALDSNEKVVALGHEAKRMHERENPGLRTVRPLQNGVIADFTAAEHMIRGFIQQATHRRSSFFSPNLKVVVGIPSGSTQVETRAVRESTEHAGGREVFLIFEPMAAALGAGLDVMVPKGNMVVDIGGGTTEIAVISLGGIVEQESIRIAGDRLTNDIQQYLKTQYNIKVGETTAEQVKISVGSVLTELDDEPDPFTVRGPNLMTALPIEVKVTYQEIASCLEKSIAQIESAILRLLEKTPPELYGDIVESGIYLSGGGALLRGLDKRLYEKINIPFHITEDPLKAVARGTCVALKGTDHYPFLMS